MLIYLFIYFLNQGSSAGVAPYTFNPSTQESEAVDLSVFEASLVNSVILGQPRLPETLAPTPNETKQNTKVSLCYTYILINTTKDNYTAVQILEAVTNTLSSLVS